MWACGAWSRCASADVFDGSSVGDGRAWRREGMGLRLWWRRHGRGKGSEVTTDICNEMTRNDEPFKGLPHWQRLSGCTHHRAHYMRLLFGLSISI